MPDCSTYYIGEKQMLWRAYAYAQALQSISPSHKQNKDVKEGSDKKKVSMTLLNVAFPYIR